VNALMARVAIEMGVFLLIGMTAREYARAWMAATLGDPTPRLWGRLTVHPRAWFDPFGSGFVPALILVLWAANASLLPAPTAYGKPAPVDPSYFRRPVRDQVLVGLAGPIANVALGAVAGLIIRGAASSLSPELLLGLAVFEFTQFSLAIFHLLPVPGLDGARLVGLLLPPEAASVYRNLDKYLALFVLVAIFVIAGPIQSIVFGLVRAMCDLASTHSCPFP
jgi:Zn-dependent protease